MRGLVLSSIAFVVAIISMWALCGCKRAEPTKQSHDLFVNACSRCHGQDGTGGLPVWEGGPSPRNFRDHSFQKSKSDFEIKQTIRNGKGVGMPPFNTTFDEAQLDALVLQVRSFDPEK